MGTTNLGSQIVSFAFGSDAKSIVFNQINYQLHEQGIYYGGTTTITNTTTLTLAPFVAFLYNTASIIGIKIETTDNVVLTVDPTKPYLYISMLWQNQYSNYADFTFDILANQPANSIIVGKCIFDGSNNLIGFDTSRQNRIIKANDISQKPLHVYPTEPPSNEVDIIGGTILTYSGLVTYPNGPSPVLSNTTLGRVDLIYLDTSTGLYATIEGVDSSTPTTPAYAGRLVIAEIHRGASATTIEYNDITEITPNFLYNVNDGGSIVGGKITLSGLTPNRLMYTDSSDTTQSVTDFSTWFSDSTNQTHVVSITGGKASVQLASDVSVSSSVTVPIINTDTLNIKTALGTLQVTPNVNLQQNVTIAGNLTVSGTQTIVHSTDTEVTDNLLILNNGESGGGVSLLRSGIQVDRGTANDYFFNFDESTSVFRIGQYYTTVILSTKTGSFSVGETITNSGSTASAKIKSIDGTGLILTVNMHQGSFVNLDNITGSSSGATGTVSGSPAATDGTQAVATRLNTASMVDKGIAYWDGTNSLFKTYTGFTFDETGTLVSIPFDTSITGSLSVSNSVAVNTNKFTIDGLTGNTSTLGTLLVTGDLSLSSSEYIEPNNSISMKLSTPIAPTGTPSPSGGSIGTGTYYYIITALDGLGGETTLGAESTGVSVTGPSGSVALSWTAIPGAYQYKIYRTTSSGTYATPALIGTSVAYTTSFTDTLLTPSTGEPPATSTAYAIKLNSSGSSWIAPSSLLVGSSYASTSDTFQVKGTSYLNGNTSIVGTLGVSSDFSINTNKFQVTATSGNTSIAGTLGVTGVATFTAQPVMSSLTASQAVFTDGSKGLVSNAITGTGNVVMSASPTLTGTAIAASLTLSGTLISPTNYGSSSASGNISISGTSNATPGYVLLNPNGGNVGVGTTNPLRSFHINNSEPTLLLEGTGGGVDQKIWRIAGNATSSNILVFDAVNDAFTLSQPWLTVTRSGYGIGSITFPNGGVGIGGSVITSALLTLTSTTGSLLLPRMTSTQRDALTPTNGMMIYNTTTTSFQGYTSSWADIGGTGSSLWTASGSDIYYNSGRVAVGGSSFSNGQQFTVTENTSYAGNRYAIYATSTSSNASNNNYGGSFSASGGVQNYGIQASVSAPSSGSAIQIGISASNTGGGGTFSGDVYGVYAPTSASTSGANYGFYSSPSGSTSSNAGYYAHLFAPSSGSAIQIGVDVSNTGGGGTFSGDVYGVYAQVSAFTSGSSFGGYFSVSDGSLQYGVYSAVSAPNSGSATHYGIQTTTSGGGASFSGISYGIYSASISTNSGTNYAGYFFATNGATNYGIYVSAGDSYFNGYVQADGGLKTGLNSSLVTSTVVMTNGAAAATGTLTNAPVAGNPTKWIPINDNGTTRYIPCW